MLVCTVQDFVFWIVSTDGILPTTGCFEAPKIFLAARFSRLSSRFSCALVAHVQTKEQYSTQELPLTDIYPMALSQKGKVKFSPAV